MVVAEDVMSFVRVCSNEVVMNVVSVAVKDVESTQNRRRRDHDGLP